MRLKQRQKIIGAITIVALLSFFLPEHFARADFLGIGSFASSAVVNFITFGLTTIFGLVGKMMAIVANALNYAVVLRAGGDIPVVKVTWTILRDFSNMAFIILLIYMAFATIFDHGKYTFKDMIVRFLIVAILINFSLVIGNLVIDACQVLANIFIGSIGNLGDRLGSFLNPSDLLPGTGIGSNVVDAAGSGLISVLFALILALIYLFSMLVALVFSIIRVPFIWALLIVSPIAWMSHILPGTNKWWSKWWSLFLGWNLFLPVYLFFMYLGLLFLAQKDQIINAVIQSSTIAGATNPANAPLLDGVTKSLSFNLVFFYVFAAFVMVGGTWAAKEVTSMVGGGFEKGLGWAKGFVKKMPLPYVGNLQAGETAAKARYGQFQQEGFKQGGFVNKWTGGAANKVFGGKDAQTRADAKAGKFFGVRGGDLKLQKELVDQAAKIYQDIERQFQDGLITIGEIATKALKYEATNPNGFAYRKLAAKVGQLTNDVFISTLTQLKDNPYAAQDFVKTAKEGKFSKMKGGDLAKMAAASKADGYGSLESSVGARRELFRYVQTDTKAIAGLNYDQFKAGLELFGGHTTADGKAYMKDIGKVSPDFVADYNIAHSDQKADAKEGYEKAYGHPPSNDFQLKVHMLTGSLKSGDVKTTANIKTKTWEGVPEFSEALKIYLSQLSIPARKSYIRSLEKALVDSPGGDKKLAILYNQILNPSHAPTTTPIAEPLPGPTTTRI